MSDYETFAQEMNSAPFRELVVVGEFTGMKFEDGEHAVIETSRLTDIPSASDLSTMIIQRKEKKMLLAKLIPALADVCGEDFNHYYLESIAEKTAQLILEVKGRRTL